jgi:hypothetical protein
MASTLGGAASVWTNDYGHAYRTKQEAVPAHLGPLVLSRIPVVVDDVLPLAVVIDRLHGAVGEPTMPDDRIIFH